MSCLDVDTAVAYLAGELDQLDADRCAAHVAECASCRDLLRDASALIDEVRQDLLVLDGALEDTAPPPIEDIFTRARRSIAVVDFAEIDVPAAPAAVTAPADERVVTERRTTRNTLLTAAAAIVVVLLLPSGTWAWVAATVRGAFDRAFGSSQDAPSDLRVGPTTSGGDVSLPPPTRTPPAVVKRPKAESPVRLSHSQSAMLEMDVLARLDTVGALLQGQVTVSRTDAGVEVRGLVEDVQTQRAVAEALAPLSRAPVSVKVQTVSEALRQMPPPAAPSIRYQPLEYDAAGIPAATDVRAHLIRAGHTQDLDDEVRRVATTALRHSRAALLHALAMESLAERYDAAALRELNRDAYETWLRLISKHATACASETRKLGDLLEPVFVRDPAGLETPPISESVETVNSAVPRLRRLAVTIDDVVRQGLTASTERVERVQVRERDFWQTVRQAERLAQSFSK